MRIYLFRVAGAALAILLALALSSLAVDAFGLFGTRILSERIFPHDTRFRSGADRIIKAIEIARDQDIGKDILLVGTSRVAFGFDLEAPPLAGLNAFNAALSGAQAVEIANVATYAADHWPKLHRIVWGLDYDSFFGHDDYDGDFLDSGFAGQPLWPAYPRHLLAFDQVELTLSIAGRALRGRPIVPEMKRNGQFLYDPRALAFYRKNDGYIRQMRRGLRDLVEGEPFYAAHIDARITRVFATIAALRARGIEVDLILTPSHIMRYALYREAGLLDGFEDWKRRIASAAAAAAAEPAPGPLHAYDFALAHPIMSEEFPHRADDPEPRFVYEPTHMRPIVGSIIMAHILKQPMPMPMPEAEDFGLPLDKSVMPEHMAEQRAEIEAWVAAHGSTMTAIDTLVRDNK